MSDTFEIPRGAPTRPELPVPWLLRSQPLWLGLAELFRYDSEELWFRDGHLTRPSPASTMPPAPTAWR